jgi:hypothetical protein
LFSSACKVCSLIILNKKSWFIIIQNALLCILIFSAFFLYHEHSIIFSSFVAKWLNLCILAIKLLRTLELDWFRNEAHWIILRV